MPRHVASDRTVLEAAVFALEHQKADIDAKLISFLKTATKPDATNELISRLAARQAKAAVPALRKTLKDLKWLGGKIAVIGALGAIARTPAMRFPT